MFNAIGNYIGKISGETSAMLASLFVSRVEADGGVVEADTCLTERIQDLKNKGLWSRASAVWLPHGYKESKLYAVKGGANADLTLTRGTTRTRKGPTYVEQVPYNLWQYSESLATLPWGTANATIQSNTIAAPNGSVTADKLQGNTTLGTHYLNQNISMAEGIVSIYAKASELTKIELFSLSGSNKGTGFDLVTGVVFSVTGHSPHSSSGIEDVGDGWFRCWVYDLSWTSCRINLLNAAGEYSFAGANTTDGVYLWGAHANAGSVLNSYFPTTDRFNVPALDYTNDTCPALSLETGRTNLFVRSEEFDNASWSKTNSTVSANTILSPDGLTTADTILETTANDQHFVLQSVSKAASSIQYAYSVYLKQNGRSWVRLFVGNGANGYSQWFNIATGVVGSSLIAGVGFTLQSANVKNIGNGWYRCSIVLTTDATTSANCYVLCATGDLVTTYTGDITKGVYAWGAQLEAGSYATSYIPTTTASVSRIADGVSGLIPERTNLLLRSQQLNEAVWSITGMTGVTADSTLAPDNTLTAERILETNTASHHFLRQSWTKPSGSTTYTFSASVKPIGRDWIKLQFIGSSGKAVKWFNVTTGTIGSSLTTGSCVINNATITSEANGFYRISLSCSLVATDTSIQADIFFNTADAEESTFLGDVTKGFYVWGVQVEPGSELTTYIPTTTVSVHDGSVIGQTEGTLYFEGGTYGTGDATHENFFSINDGTSNNRIEVLFRSSDQFQCVVVTGGITVADIIGGTVVSGQSNKIAVIYGPDGVKLVVDGVKIGEDLVAAIPATSVLRTANRYDGGTSFYGFEKGRAISTTAMTEAQAIALTTP